MDTKFKVVRVEDNKTFNVNDYKFVVFENERGKKLEDKPSIGSALILPPYSGFYSWMTSEIVEIINDKHFKTKNSEYKIEENGYNNV